MKRPRFFWNKLKILARSCGIWENCRKRISLGIPPMIGTFLFPKMYKEFHRLFPDIVLNSREGGSRDLMDMLDENALDFAILPTNQIARDQYNILPLTETETVFCICKAHPLQKGRGFP